MPGNISESDSFPVQYGTFPDLVASKGNSLCYKTAPYKNGIIKNGITKNGIIKNGLPATYEAIPGDNIADIATCKYENKNGLTAKSTFPSVQNSQEEDVILSITNEKDPFRRRKQLLFILLVAMEVLGEILLTMLSPFFPVVAESKGLSPTMIGCIMASYELAMVVFSPIFGNYVHKTGVRFTYIAGALVSGICALLFSITLHAPDDYFAVVCIVILILEGIGTAAYYTTTCTVLLHAFPSKPASVYGSLETAQGAGLMLGPFVGSILYQLGGYMTPFLVVGSFSICLTILSACFIPIISVTQPIVERRCAMLQLVCKPLMMICGTLQFSCAFTFGILDVTLALHLQQFELSTLEIGLVFMCVFFGFVCCAPLWGKLVDTKPSTAYLVLFSGFSVSICVLLVAGPVPFLTFVPDDKLTVLLVDFGLLGVSLSTFVSTFEVMNQAKRENGFSDDLSTAGKIAGFSESAYCLGSCMGMLVGSVAYEHLGWEWTTAVPAALIAVTLLLLLILLLIKRFLRSKDFSEKDRRIPCLRHLTLLCTNQ